MIDDILKSPDFSLDEINIGEYLDTLLFANREASLRQILNKLNPKGTFNLRGTDIGSLTKLIANNQIDVVGANQILENIQSMDMLNNIERWFTQNGFRILKKNIEGFGQFSLTVQHNI